MFEHTISADRVRKFPESTEAGQCFSAGQETGPAEEAAAALATAAVTADAAEEEAEKAYFPRWTTARRSSPTLPKPLLDVITRWKKGGTNLVEFSEAYGKLGGRLTLALLLLAEPQHQLLRELRQPPFDRGEGSLDQKVRRAASSTLSERVLRLSSVKAYTFGMEVIRCKFSLQLCSTCWREGTDSVPEHLRYIP